MKIPYKLESIQKQENETKLHVMDLKQREIQNLQQMKFFMMGLI
jgi:hypothetical protein